jgi:hypothetical protein
VIPRFEVALDAYPPPGYDSWLPRIADDQSGYFHDTWPLVDVAMQRAGNVVAAEAKLLRLLDHLSSTPAQFEILAAAVEERDGERLGLEEQRQLSAFLVSEEEEHPLDDLETGVAGLVYALAASGCKTVASCRAHFSPRSWAPAPVVYLAAPQAWFEALIPLLREVDVGMLPDEGRPEWLVLSAASVREMHALAELLVLDQGDGVQS